MAEKTMTLDQLAGQIKALLERHPAFIGLSGYGMRTIRSLGVCRVSKKKPAELVTRGGIDAAVIR